MCDISEEDLQKYFHSILPIKYIDIGEPNDTLDRILDKIVRTDYIVRLKYRYTSDEPYIEENVFLQYNGNEDTYEWSYDWWEGQRDVYIVGIKRLDDVQDF